LPWKPSLTGHHLTDHSAKRDLITVQNGIGWPFSGFALSTEWQFSAVFFTVQKLFAGHPCFAQEGVQAGHGIAHP
ncbi:MAG: hypothetical protein ABF537_15245, partial [Acetobacter sp.]|uniref:hypothetical protein n=1 Tax=Acetobacter sp. TaxID=440 RepID=UPI0039E9E3B7